MAVVVRTKKQAVAQPKPIVPTQTADQVLAFEYITLFNRLKALEVDATLDRMEKVKKDLLALAGNAHADSAVIFSCTLGEVEFSKVPELRVVVSALSTIHLVEEKFGVAAAQSIAKVTVGDLAKVLSENEIAPLVTRVSGTRRLTEVRPKVEAE